MEGILEGLTAEMLAEWSKALRSGKYKQCKGVLHDGKGFCCLGVLLDACLEGEWVEGNFGWNFVSDSVPVMTRSLKIASTELPYNLSHNARKLADFNDTEGWSFKKIADWIDKYEIPRT